MLTDDRPKHRIFTSAILCQDVLREENKLITAVRLIDTLEAKPVEIKIEHPDGTQSIEQKYLPTVVFLIVIFGSDTGTEFKARIIVKKPDGGTITALDDETITITDGIYGFTISAQMTLDSDSERNYWFDVYVDSDLASRIPLLILHQSKESYLEALQRPADVSGQSSNMAEH